MMNQTSLLAMSLGIGIGATLIMDLWSAIMRRIGIATLNYGWLGRWCLHWKNGIWFHSSIKDAAPVRGENIIGWALHYLTGIVFAFALLTTVSPAWIHSPTVAPALLFGGVTVLIPWLVLQPALGAGLAGTKMPHPWKSRAAGFATHLIFGLGVYLSAKAISLT